MRRESMVGIEAHSGQDSISYVICAERIFDKTGYNVLQNQQKGYLLECAKSLYNGKVKITYFAPQGSIPLRKLVEHLDEASLQRVLGRLADAVYELAGNGFLDGGNVVAGLDDVFVEPSSLHVRVAYVPVSTFASGASAGGICEDIALLCEDIAECDGRFRDVALKVNVHAQESAGDLSRFRSLLRTSLSLSATGGAGGSLREHLGEPPSRDKVSASFFLQGMGPKAKLLFRVGSESVVLGRSPSKAQLVIADEPKVSRSHCELRALPDGLKVTDLGSANGTYVSGRRLGSGSSAVVREGMTLGVAELSFLVTKAS